MNEKASNRSVALMASSSWSWADSSAVSGLANQLSNSVAAFKAVFDASGSGSIGEALAAAELVEHTGIALRDQILTVMEHAQNHIMASNRLQNELEYVKHHAAADVALAQQRLDQSEGAQRQMRWDHIRDRERIHQEAMKHADGLLAKVHSANKKLGTLESKAKADAQIARHALDDSEVMQQATQQAAREKLAAELVAQQAEARAVLAHNQTKSDHVEETLTKRLETLTQRLLASQASDATCCCTMMREISRMEAAAKEAEKSQSASLQERNNATAELAQEIERLRGIIANVSVPAPPASSMKKIHLEALKKGPNPVVLRTVRSQPLLASLGARYRT